MPLVHQVEEPAGRRDEDVESVPQGGDLASLSDAAVDHGVSESEMSSVVHEAVVDLIREFAGGAEDQGAGRTASHPLTALAAVAATGATIGHRRFAGLEALEDRECEGAGLPGSGLAQPSTSRPVRASGMAWAWMGVGVSYPSSETARRIGADSPRS